LRDTAREQFDVFTSRDNFYENELGSPNNWVTGSVVIDGHDNNSKRLLLTLFSKRIRGKK